MAELTEPQLVADAQCEIGENPLWHPDTNELFFLDIAAGRVYAYDPANDEYRLFSEGPTTGGMVLHEDGSLVLFQDGRVSILGLDGTQREVASGLCPDNDRFNDVIADPAGRVFAGTIGGDGKLLRFDTNGSVTQLLDGIGVPNGMGFTPDLNQMYFTDSVPREMYVFDYDQETGALSNQRVFATIPEDEGVPDGMVIDAEGYIWTAVWFGGRVKRYAPDGTLEREIHFPVRQTSAPTFGGADLSDLYVTTAGTNLADSMMPPGHDASQPRGGGLYRVRSEGIRGTEQFRAQIQFS